MTTDFRRITNNMAVFVPILVILVALGIFTRRYTVNPDIIQFSQVRMSKESIILQQGSFSGSSLWYCGKRVIYNEGVLVVEIFARSVKVLGCSSDPFTILLPNIYQNIREIHLGGGQFSEKIIWCASENSIQ